MDRRINIYVSRKFYPVARKRLRGLVKQLESIHKASVIFIENDDVSIGTCGFDMDAILQLRLHNLVRQEADKPVTLWEKVKAWLASVTKF